MRNAAVLLFRNMLKDGKIFQLCTFRSFDLLSTPLNAIQRNWLLPNGFHHMGFGFRVV